MNGDATAMGIYDRGYFDGDQWKGGSGNDRPQMRFGLGSGDFKQTVVAKIILINLIVFALDVFSPRVTFQAINPSGAAAFVAISNLVLAQEPNAEANDSNKTKAGESKSQWINVNLALKHGMSQFGYPGPAENPLYVYQFLTYGFTHTSISDGFGITHIAFNMWLLFLFGMPIEEKYGKEEFLKIYMLALLLAGLVWWAMTAFVWQSAGRATGASGAVVAVTMLFVFNFPKQQIRFFGIIPAPAWVMGVLLIGSDIVSSLSSESRIAVEAHFTGAAFAAMYFYGKLGLGWLKFDWITDRFSGKPKLKVHAPDNEEALNSEADRILEKVHREGESSLTRKEKKILQRYSKNVRKTRDDEN